MLYPKDQPGPIDGERLKLIHHLLTLVIPPGGIALGVLVGEDAAHRLQHSARHVVLRRNQADRPCLPRDLLLDQPGDSRVHARNPWLSRRKHTHGHLQLFARNAQARGSLRVPLPDGAPPSRASRGSHPSLIRQQERAPFRAHTSRQRPRRGDSWGGAGSRCRRPRAPPFNKARDATRAAAQTL